MTDKTKLILTITCRAMKEPKKQRSRFDQTLGEASWLLQENQKPFIHSNGTVTTTTEWGRVFGKRKAEQELIKSVHNLLKRAAAYAEIEDYTVDLQFMAITDADENFARSSVLISED